MPACPICHYAETRLWSAAKDFEYFTSEKTYDYFLCGQCRCLFIHPMPVAELRRIYPANYYSFVAMPRNAVTAVKEKLDARFFRQVLKKIGGSQLKVLDVGGGTGWLSTLLRHSDPRITTTQVVDIDKAARQQAEAAGHLYFQGMLEAFETTERYDLILMLNLIEHVSDPQAVLKKAATLLQPGGLLVIKTPNYESLDARLFQHSYWGGLHCPRHWVIFSEKSFRQLAGTLPLQIRSCNYTQGGPFWAFSIIVALHRRKLLRVSKERPVIFHPLFPFVAALAAAFDFLRRPFSKTSQLFLVLGKTAGEP